jgi:hypothetical protein
MEEKNNSFVLNPAAQSEENKRIKHTSSRDTVNEALICPGAVNSSFSYFPLSASK